MTCYLCNLPIDPHSAINLHHPEYKSNGGTETEPTHQQCHVRFHSTNGDFKRWGSEGGKIAAQTKRWAFNLLNVRDNPAYQDSRDFYLMNYAYAGWTEGLI
jgi:hypothetical protein